MRTKSHRDSHVMLVFLRLFNRKVFINSLSRLLKPIVPENGIRLVNENLNRLYFSIYLGKTVRIHPSTFISIHVIFMSRMKRLKSLRKHSKRFLSRTKLGKRFTCPSKWIISPITMDCSESAPANSITDESKSYYDVVECDSFSESNDNIVEIYKKIRQDVYTPYGNWILDRSDERGKNGTLFKVVSYNILAQYLLMLHPALYRSHDDKYLTWDYRKVALINEFKNFDADILCLQEVEASKLDFFDHELGNLGYRGVFKKRTHEKDDGCSIYYRTNKFHLREHVSVEYYQPNVSLLNRDNIGIVARFSPWVDLNKNLVVATTHLLFNPRRHDIKLAQMQILLAEIDRIAYRRINERGCTTYCPIILTGDFNAQPDSMVYKLLASGMVHNVPQTIPDQLGISDSCQHFEVVQKRNVFRTEMDISDHRFVKLFNSDRKSHEATAKNYDNNWRCNDYYHFCSRHLSHRLDLASVYPHFKNVNDTQNTVTTYQDGWCTVDYIFYGPKHVGHRRTSEGLLQLVSYWQLPTREEILRLSAIPSEICPSDHFPLAATFHLPF